MRLLALLSLVLANSASAVELQELQPFLQTYCVSCHGPEKQKGDRRFDQLRGDLADHAEAEMMQEILDQLNLAEMPPDDEKQPPQKTIDGIVATLTMAMAEARELARRNVGKVVLRRLNRAEYRNTISDLFAFEMRDFDPTTTFPPDDALKGFDNIGEGLVTAEHQLENYLQAARAVAQKVVRPGSRPKMIHYQATGEAIKGARKGFGGEVARMFIRFRQPLGLAQLHKPGVPADGEYVIRLRTRAHQRKSRYKDGDLRLNSDEPMRLAISIDSRALGATAHRIIGEYEIPDDEPIEIEHRVWLDKGFSFHLHWANGPNGSFKRIMRKVLHKYNPDALAPTRNPPEMYIGSGPELHVYSLAIEGPFYDAWPPPGFARYFPRPPAKPDEAYLRKSLLRLANSAFRRPVPEAELAPYLDLASDYLTAKKDFWAAARYGLRAILTSPRFLYIIEQEGTRLDAFELATRLSYFLWSSMPDELLREAAAKGELATEAGLRRQVERMLQHPRAQALSDNFLEQWLHLRKLGEMPPDPASNKAYYADNLEAAMRHETRRAFEHVLAGNRSILEFVDADYSFLNAALARHYQIPGVAHDDFQRVALKPEHHRGGLLSHGSVLTATSNGVETQPVVRGVWILENLLGAPPNPPPPDVDPIEPDTRGGATIRQLMDKHRNNPTCHACHRKIDPLGLAMEHYDHVGLWRDRYAKRLHIDGSGEMPDGSAIAGPDGIKRYLLDRPQQFARCLSEKLLTYSLGRRLSFTDRDDIDHIVTTIATQNYGLRELIQQVVASEAFHSK